MEGRVGGERGERSLSNVHICIYGVKASELPAELFRAVQQSSVIVSITGDSWKREREREGERERERDR